MILASELPKCARRMERTAQRVFLVIISVLFSIVTNVYLLKNLYPPANSPSAYYPLLIKSNPNMYRPRQPPDPNKILLQSLWQSIRQKNTTAIANYKQQLCEDVQSSEASSLTFLEVYEKLLQQALRSVSNSISSQMNDQTVIHFVLEILHKGLAPPILPPLLFQGMMSKQQDAEIYQRLASQCILMLAAFRRPKQLEKLLQTLAENTSNQSNASASASASTSATTAISHILQYTDESHGTPLHVAAKVGASQCVYMLLQYGADPNAQFNPRFALYTNSVLERALQVLRYATTNDNSDTQFSSTEEASSNNIVEPVQYLQTIQTLIHNGVMLQEKEVQVTMLVSDISIVETIIAAASQQFILSPQILPTLAAIAMVKDQQRRQQKQLLDSTNDAIDKISRLSILLQYGLDPNAYVDRLTAPWDFSSDNNSTSTNTSGVSLSSQRYNNNKGKAMNLLELAIQINSVPALEQLLKAGGSLAARNNLWDRILSLPLTEDILQTIERSLEQATDALNPIIPPTFRMTSNKAWVGNAVDFEQYLEQQSTPTDAKRTTSPMEPNQYPAKLELPIQKGEWIGLALLPTMQVAFWTDCPEEYLIGAVTGAMYGGFKAGAWNPLYPPESDIVFTGRMVYSEYEPRHITWLMPAISKDTNESNNLQTLEAIRNATIPDPTLFEQLGSVSLVGTWKNHQTSSTATDPAGAFMWTCRQEYRYGIMVGGKVFISIGYEAMDLPQETVAFVLDGVLRAKRHYHQVRGGSSRTSNSQTIFLRTEFSSTQSNYLKSIPKKRTPTEMFEYRLAKGDKFTGVRAHDTKPDESELFRFGPRERIYNDSATIKAMYFETFNSTIAEPLENEVTVLIDELIMMFLHKKVTPALNSLVFTNDMTVDKCANEIGGRIFPQFERQHSIDHGCYQALVRSLNETEATITSTTSSSADLRDVVALQDRVTQFFKVRVSSTDDDPRSSAEGSVLLSLSLLLEQGLAQHVVNVCNHLLHKLLELADFNRIDSQFPVLVPQNVRHSLGVNPLCEIFGANLVAEFYYPSTET